MHPSSIFKSCGMPLISTIKGAGVQKCSSCIFERALISFCVLSLDLTCFVLHVNCGSVGLVFPTCLTRTQLFLKDFLYEASSIVSFHCDFCYFENSLNNLLSSHLHCWPLQNMSGFGNHRSSKQCLLHM